MIGTPLFERMYPPTLQVLPKLKTERTRTESGSAFASGGVLESVNRRNKLDSISSQTAEQHVQKRLDADHVLWDVL